MPNLDPIQISDFHNGLITQEVIAESQFPLAGVSESVNFSFDKIGGAKLRKGTTLLGDAGVLSGNILGLYEFRDSGAGSNNQIIAVNGTVAYYLSGSTWTSKRTSLTAASKARFTTFLDYVFMVNGTEATAIWDGNPSNSFLTTGNAASAPTGKFIDNYRARVWIAGNTSYPDRVYYSSLPSAVTTPIITWDTSVNTGDWIDVSPMDGENITGLKRSKSSLLVFKNNHIYRLYSVNEVDLDPKINRGTYSNESIVEGEDRIYFHHPTGIYSYLDGGIQKISKPIQDIINGVALSQYANVCGWTDGDKIYHSLGNVTVGDVTYTNVVSAYSISNQNWTIYSYPSKFLFASPYNDGSNLFRLVGDDAGSVLKHNIGNTDNGTPVTYSLITRWYTFDGLYSTRKKISKMCVMHNKAIGAKVEWQADNDSAHKWNPLYQIEQELEKAKNVDIKGKKIRFRVSGVSSGEPFTFLGFELLELSSNLEE